jgi:ABC-2 type transport system permease protein
MYRLLIKQFLRSRMMVGALLLLFALGVVSIFVGRQFLAQQEERIVQVTAHQRTHLERNVAAHNEMGLLLYYLRFALISPPDRLSALSIGQRDVNPGIQSVTVRTLEGQKYDTDLTNPVQLQAGNLDLGFVILYLFPLVIIACTFNILSEDRESGTWKTIVVQARSVVRVLLARLLVRAVFVLGLLLALLLVAAVVVPLPWNEAFLAFAVLSILYSIFWFALAFWLALFKQGSGGNVLTLLAIWVALTILLPASVNNLVATLHPVPESLSTLLKQRDGYHQKWDEDKHVTLNQFYAQYPQFAHYGIPTEPFHWGWYYAMQQAGDDEARADSEALRDKMLLREKTSRSIARVIPTLHAQLSFNDLAQTGLTDYLRLLDSATVFHERTRLYFYPRIFEGTAVKNEDWRRWTPEYVAPRQSVHWLPLALPLVSMIGLLLGCIWIRSRNMYTL